MTASASIIAASARAFGVDEADLFGKRRFAHIVRARHAAWWMLSAFADPHGEQRTLGQIGRLFGTDHSTIYFGVKQAAQRLGSDPEFAEGIATAGGLIASGTVMLPDPAPAREPVGTFRHVKRKNELTEGDSDARKRMHGTFALGRALQAALSKPAGMTPPAVLVQATEGNPS